MPQIPDKNFWHGKRVLLTGHTGFKGSWMSILLSSLKAKVYGISLDPKTSPNLFQLACVESIIESSICDIKNLDKLRKLVKQFDPNIVIHMAAQPLVRESYLDPIETFATNIMGTANLLEVLRDIESVKSVVCITTDKVYKNKEQLKPYKEDDELGGYDPYSSSKAASELIISSYRDSFFNLKDIGLATARAGNVIGGGDWSHDRLIPDAIRAWSKGESVRVRFPKSVRPWQHVIEPLFGYLVLAENLYSNPAYSGSYNFGPNPNDHLNVETVLKISSAAFGKGDIILEKNDNLPHEAGLLTLDNSKSKNLLHIEPVFDHHEAISLTVNWYKKQLEGDDALKLCKNDIDSFTTKASQQ